MAVIFSGFSTKASNSNFKLYDEALIRQDLMNHFMTKKGERILRPKFGCDIHKYVFQQATASTKNGIMLAAKEVFDSDRRVEVNDIEVTHTNNLIVVSALLKLKVIDSEMQFIINFNEKEVF
jgi:phage baseplate assembly protein W